MVLILAIAVALLGYRFARGLVPDAVARAVGRLVAWIAAPLLFGLLVAYGPAELRGTLLAFALAVGFAFFVAERRRATAAEREAARKARVQAMRQQRRRLPPPAPPPSAGTRTTP